jgi:monovalent cation:H+ antiporter, CPA1 family
VHLLPLLVVAIAAGILYGINRRLGGLPATIGVTVWALVASLALVAAGALGSPVHDFARRLVARVHFRETLLDGMLSLLLFAGALEVDLDALLGERALVAVLATAGVAISTAIVGGLTLLVARLCGLPVDLRESLLFGAIISPTDPIAVLGMLRKAHAPKQLEVQMAGESLFNDAIGVVVFFTLLEVAAGHTVGAGAISLSFVEQVAGGAAFGLGAGWIARKVLGSIDRAGTPLAIVVTLGIAIGLSRLAEHLHASGYLAVIIAGLMLGGLRTSSGLHRFWEIVDGILNVLLFTMVGFEVLVIPFTARVLGAGLLAIPVVLLARLVVVGGTLAPFARR